MLVSSSNYRCSGLQHFSFDCLRLQGLFSAEGDSEEISMFWLLFAEGWYSPIVLLVGYHSPQYSERLYPPLGYRIIPV